MKSPRGVFDDELVDAQIVDGGPTVSIQPRWPEHAPEATGRQAVVDVRIGYGRGNPTGEVLLTVSGHSLAVGRIIATVMQAMADAETESWQ